MKSKNSTVGIKVFLTIFADRAGSGPGSGTLLTRTDFVLRNDLLLPLVGSNWGRGGGGGYNF